MSTVLRNTSQWYQAAKLSLAGIETNASAYEDVEEGDKAPGEEVFEAAKAFLEKLSHMGNFEIEQPRINVSPNGHLGLSFGDKKRSLDVLITPKIHFYFKGEHLKSVTGDCETEAVNLATKYFRLS